MRSKKAIRLEILKWRQTEPELILCGVRWYLRYSLSFRDAAELLSERGLEADINFIVSLLQNSQEAGIFVVRGKGG